MSKPLRVISINFGFQTSHVIEESSLGTDKALFDFDVVVIRPEKLSRLPAGKREVYSEVVSTMQRKKMELDSLFAQGGVLVVFIDVPDDYRVASRNHSGPATNHVDNYEFLSHNFAWCLREGTGQQITYIDPTEPFVPVLKKSKVAWTAYFKNMAEAPFNHLKFFALAGAGGALAAKMPYKEGHLDLPPEK